MILARFVGTPPLKLALLVMPGGLKTESGRLGTKAEPGGWRIRVTLLCQRAEVEPGDLRTKAELRAGKTEVEPEVMRTTMELKGWWC